jgi:hypothetical protein
MKKTAIGLLSRICKPTEPRSYHVEMVRLKSGIAIQPERRRGSAACGKRSRVIEYSVGLRFKREGSGITTPKQVRILPDPFADHHAGKVLR